MYIAKHLQTDLGSLDKTIWPEYRPSLDLPSGPLVTIVPKYKLLKTVTTYHIRHGGVISEKVFLSDNPYIYRSYPRVALKKIRMFVHNLPTFGFFMSEDHAYIELFNTATYHRDKYPEAWQRISAKYPEYFI